MHRLAHPFPLLVQPLSQFSLPLFGIQSTRIVAMNISEERVRGFWVEYLNPRSVAHAGWSDCLFSRMDWGLEDRD